MSEPLVPRLGRASSALQLARFLLDQLTWYLSGYVFIAIHELFTHMFGKWGLDRRTQAKIGPLRFLVGRIKISHKCRRDVLLFCRLTTCNWRSQTFWLNCNTSSATPCTFFPFSFPGTALFALRRFLRRGVRIFSTHRPGEVRCGLETMVKPWNQNSLHRYARCPSGCLCQLYKAGCRTCKSRKRKWQWKGEAWVSRPVKMLFLIHSVRNHQSCDLLQLDHGLHCRLTILQSARDSTHNLLKAQVAKNSSSSMVFLSVGGSAVPESKNVTWITPPKAAICCNHLDNV